MANDSDLDLALALSLQDQFNQEASLEKVSTAIPIELVEKRCDPRKIVDEYWELADPNPNIHDLFVEFDAMFFERVLTNAGVEVRWSYKMTL